MVAFVLLIAISTVAVLEVRARFGMIAAMQRLEAAQLEIETNRFAPTLTQERVQALLGRTPTLSHEDVRSFHRQTYTWRGVFRKYTLNTYFRREKPAALDHFEID